MDLRELLGRNWGAGYGVREGITSPHHCTITSGVDQGGRAVGDVKKRKPNPQTAVPTDQKCYSVYHNFTFYVDTQHWEMYAP